MHYSVLSLPVLSIRSPNRHTYVARPKPPLTLSPSYMFTVGCVRKLCNKPNSNESNEATCSILFCVHDSIGLFRNGEGRESFLFPNDALAPLSSPPLLLHGGSHGFSSVPKLKPRFVYLRHIWYGRGHEEPKRRGGRFRTEQSAGTVCPDSTRRNYAAVVGAPSRALDARLMVALTGLAHREEHSQGITAATQVARHIRPATFAPAHPLCERAAAEVRARHLPASSHFGLTQQARMHACTHAQRLCCP